MNVLVLNIGEAVGRVGLALLPVLPPMALSRS